ncbi:MAG: methylated-DNA--[protein]-cysteine S-methyltransferase [Eubacteriales bacterium]|nr:methylated-DNA--[protein]-cysteine S-methyltransferase [Eubacteriales bacterium]MDD4583611.1 methylated-DNA--[protein]-cysteine S-methyltransferase [Eubacteriales bacterium]
MKSYYYFNTKIGKIGIAENGTAITHVQFANEKPPLEGGYQKTPLLKMAAEQLREYFEGKRTDFNLPLSPAGTEFQLKVWKALQTIPYGETRSYRQVAEIIKKPKACRAVGMANNRNPIAIIIPCHRVIGSNGNLVGYGGGLDLKQQLLDLEKQIL